MFSEDDLIPVSALQHLEFCPRQWGLMYLENIWDENVLTAEGGLFHERVDEDQLEIQDELVITRGLRLRSLQYGLVGRADAVEFHRLDDTLSRNDQAGVTLKCVPGLWSPYPVEYKRGRPKLSSCDEVQICGQALCLEEMLSTRIDEGAIFYGEPRRRQTIAFSSRLRNHTIELIHKLHKLYRENKIPPGKYSKKCRSCSIISFCIPKVTTKKKSARYYLEKHLTDAKGESP